MTPMRMRVGFAVMYVPAIITYIFAIWVWTREGTTCANPARFAFAIFEFTVCLIFGATSILTLQRVVKKVAVSSNYMVRHTRPMVIVNLVYLWMSLTGLAMRSFFHVSASPNAESCREMLLGFPDWVVYTYGIYLWIELIAPPLAIYWYFYKTVQQNKQVDVFGIDDPNFPSWTANTDPSISLSININGKYTDYRIESMSSYSEIALDESMESDVSDLSDYEYNLQ